MRTKMHRALGSDGVAYIVFCRFRTCNIRTTHGIVEKQGLPKFYLGNGDLLEHGAAGTLKTQDGNLILRVVSTDLPAGVQAQQTPDENSKSEAQRGLLNSAGPLPAVASLNNQLVVGDNCLVN